jgi:hypothetical protein
LRNGLAVPVHAGHHDDAAIPPIVSRGKDPAMPKRKNRAISGFINVIEVTIAFRFPPYGAADDLDNPVANPAD